MALAGTFWLSMAVAAIVVIPLCLGFAIYRFRQGDRSIGSFGKYMLLVPMGLLLAGLIILCTPILDLLGLGVHLVDFGSWIKSKLLDD